MIAIRWVSEARWPAAYLTYVPPLLWAAPLVGLGAVAAIRRDRFGFRVWLIAVILWAGPGMGAAIPFGARPPRSGNAAIRVLSWNVQKAPDGWGAIRAAVTHLGPDIVVLQEIGVDQAAVRAAEACFPGWTHSYDQDVFIASRFARAIDASSRSAPTAFPLATLDVAAGGSRVRVLGVHLKGPTYRLAPAIERQGLRRALGERNAERRQQVATLLHRIGRRDAPTIVAGDFNTPPFGRLYRQLTADLRSAFAVGGWGWGNTYPSHLPVQRIDHVLVSRDWRVSGSRIVTLPGSDHRAVVADISLPTR